MYILHIHFRKLLNVFLGKFLGDNIDRFPITSINQGLFSEFILEITLHYLILFYY